MVITPPTSPWPWPRARGSPPARLLRRLSTCIEDTEGIIERVEVAGPGFINFFLKDAYWHQCLREADQQGERYGEGELGRGKRALVEFLSANPTGPLHIGHGRIAAFGDALANLLAKVGYAVEREYYVNDIGTQMRLLGRSVYLRYMQEWGKEVEFPADGYQGEYIKDIARAIKKEAGDTYLVDPSEEQYRRHGGKGR